MGGGDAACARKRPRPLCRTQPLQPPSPPPSHARRCSLESGVSTEAIARARFYPQLKAAMAKLPAKMWEIDGEAPVEVEEAEDPRGHGPRVALCGRATRNT